MWLISLFVALTFATSTFAQDRVPWPLNTDFPANLSARVYLPAKYSDALGQGIGNLIGRLVVLKDSQFILTASRALTGQPPALVKLEQSQPAYKAILDKSTKLTAAIPVLGISWADSMKAQVVVTDIASLLVPPENFPSEAIWARYTPNSNIYWIEGVKLSVVSVNRLEKDTGSGSGLFSFLSFGAERYRETNIDERYFIVSLMLVDPYALEKLAQPEKERVAAISSLAPKLPKGFMMADRYTGAAAFASWENLKNGGIERMLENRSSSLIITKLPGSGVRAYTAVANSTGKAAEVSEYTAEALTKR